MQGSRPCSVKIKLTKSKEVKTGCNLAESSKEDYGSKRAVLPMMRMMTVIMIVTCRLKAGTVKSEKTAICRQRLVETRFGNHQVEQSVAEQR
jgi:hypothetical protein